MKHAFSLIELIFTIVIMAGIFAVIPKIVFATNKSDLFAIKQEAFFNAISLTNIASLLAWDEKNTETLSILDTSSPYTPLDCNKTTHLRKGGFLSTYARSCQEDEGASLLGADTGEDDYLLYDDIDDFASYEVDVTKGSKTKYKIYTTVEYFDDDIFDTTGDTMTITLQDANDSTTNIKKFKAVIGYVGGRGKDKNISSFYYYSTNIGQITLNSEEW